jgi:hypothetical protein
MQHPTTATHGRYSNADFVFTQHAKDRMAMRRVGTEAIDAALTFGRTVHTRGAEIHAIGRKEVSHYGRLGIDLARYQGVQVVVSPDGHIITVYRNHSFRGLRVNRGACRPALTQ